MKHPPYIKNFCDKVTVNIYYSMHCVMVIRTTHHCVMGCKIARMWQSARHRLTKKLYKKVFILQKEVCQPYDFCGVYSWPTLLNFRFYFA